MKKAIFLAAMLCCGLLSKPASAQIDFSHIDINDLIGKIMTVDKGFSPKFYIANVKIPKVSKVAEILGMKNSNEINKLFKTFRTGRTIFQITTYAGSAIAIYGVAKKIDNAATKKDYQAAFATAISAVGTGVLVKLLTKGASYKAVDLFNHVAIKSIKDIFKISAASQGVGVGLYVKL